MLNIISSRHQHQLDAGRHSVKAAADPFPPGTRQSCAQSMLLALLVRSGCWLDAEAMAGRLEFRGLHVGGGATPAVPSREGSWSVADPDTGGSSSSSSSSSTVAAAVDTGSAASSSSSSSSGSGGGAPAQPSSPKGPARRPSKRLRRISVSPSKPAGSKAPIYIDIALKGTKMLARVEICPDTWRPVGFGQALVGWDEGAAACQPPSLWVFEDWQLWSPPPAVPLGVAALGGPAAAAAAVRMSAGAAAAQQQQQRDGCVCGGPRVCVGMGWG